MGDNILDTVIILAGFIVVLIVLTYSVGTVVDSFVDKTLPYAEDIESDDFRSLLPGIYQTFNSIYLIIPVLMVVGFIWAFKRIFVKTVYRKKVEQFDSDEYYR